MMSRVMWASALATVALAGALVVVFATGQRSPLVVSPEALDFGELRVGESRSGVVVVTNTGDTVAEIDRVELPDAFRPIAPFALAPGASTALLVELSSSESGAVEGDLVLASSDLSAEHRVALSGALLGLPSIEVSPLFVSFGEVGLGSESRSPIFISNHGETDLEVDAIGGSGGFTGAPESLTVPPGETRELMLSFAPPALRQFERRLLLVSNDPRKPELSVSLDGTGVETPPRPAMVLSPGEIDFGPVPVGAALDQWLTVGNEGSDPLTVSTMETDSPFFTSSRSREIEPGQSLQLPVTCRPAADGPSRRQLRVYSNDPEAAEASVALLCQGATGALALQAARRPGIYIPEAGDRVAGVELPPEVAVEIANNPTGGQRRLFPPGTGPEASAPLAEAGSGLDPEIDPERDPSLDPVLPPQRVDSGVVDLASYKQFVEHYHVGSVDFDPNTGRFSLNDVQLPTVDAALGQFFEFEPVEVEGYFEPGGSAEVPVELTMYDPQHDREFTIQMTLTTEQTQTWTSEGLHIKETGRPLGSDGSATLVGVHTFTEGPFVGSPFRISLDVLLNAQEAQL